MKNEIVYSRYQSTGVGSWQETTYSLPSIDEIEKQSGQVKEELSKLMTTKSKREKELKSIAGKLDKLEIEIGVLKVKRNETIAESGSESSEAIVLNKRCKDMLREIDILQEEKGVTQKYLRGKLLNEIRTAEAQLNDLQIKLKQIDLVELARQYNEIAPHLAEVVKKYLSIQFSIPAERQADCTAVVGVCDGSRVAEMNFKVLMPIIPKLFVKSTGGMSTRDFQKQLFDDRGNPKKSAFQYFSYSEAAREYEKSIGKPEKKRVF